MPDAAAIDAPQSASSATRLEPGGAVLSELGQDVDIELALERDDQLRQLLRRDPLPSVEFRMLGGEVDIGVVRR